MTASPAQVNGTKPSTDMSVLGAWQPIGIEPIAAPAEPGPPPTPTVDPRAEAEAEAIRARTAAETEAARTKAEADAKAALIAAEADKAAKLATAEAEAEKLKISNRRAAMKLEADQAAHDKRVAELNAQRVAADAAAEKAKAESAAEAEQEAEREVEQKRSESLWKWGARGIYLVGLVIAAPVQFIAFWDSKRPFLVAAPALLEGLALVLAAGAAWAVAHRRDVAPYRVGIMLGALIAAGINLWHGVTDAHIGLNAGLIGALASLGGPIVLMAYEHGMAQKADGIPSRRERRAVKKQKEAEAKAREKAKAEKTDAETKAKIEKAEQQQRAEAEQERRDADRQQRHSDVWEVAEALRSARGSESVTEQIWGDAWYRVTGSKLVGIRPEIEARSRDALARMKAATEGTLSDDSSQVESQNPSRPKRDPDAPDGRRFNGGTPPLRRAGDTQPYSEAAKKQATLEQQSIAAKSAVSDGATH